MVRATVSGASGSSAQKPILVATDFSPDAVRATEIASQLARELGAEIILIYADEPLVENVRSNEQLWRRQEANAELARTTRVLEAKGIAARWSLRVGKPAREIIDAAATEGARLIVIGTRGCSPAVSTLLGGVAYEVVRKAPCPVLTVRASETVTRPSRGKATAKAARTRARVLRRDRRR
jgi:nucleotide-binding universal stress UspA family protein